MSADPMAAMPVAAMPTAWCPPWAWADGAACSTWGQSFVPHCHQNRNVAPAISNTSPLKRPAMRSARPWIGALRAWASSTRAMIRATALSEPLRSTCRVRGASRLRLPAASSLPGPACRGKGSPVRLDASTAERPSSTRPSTGTRSPGSNSTRSSGRNPPTRTGLGGPSPSTNRAVSGCRAASCSRARPVRKRARSSMKRPSNTKPSSITGSLKKHCQPREGTNRATRLAR